MKIKFLTWLLAWAALAFLGACHKLETPASSHINGYEFIAKDQNITKNSDGSVSGTGTIIFRKQLSANDPTNRFMLKFSLEDKGKLETVLKANEKLESGLSLDFKRTNNQLSTTIGYTTSLERYDVTPYLSQSENEKNSNDFEFVIDLIALRKSTLRVLIWEHTPDKKSSPSFDSQEHMHLADFIGGTFWGLVLDHAKIFSVSSESLPEKTQSPF